MNDCSFSPLYYSIIHNVGLHPAIVFGYIDAWCKYNAKHKVKGTYHDGVYWMYTTHQTIADHFRLSRRSVLRAIRQLQEAGYLEVRPRPGKTGTHQIYKTAPIRIDKCDSQSQLSVTHSHFQ